MDENRIKQCVIEACRKGRLEEDIDSKECEEPQYFVEKAIGPAYDE